MRINYHRAKSIGGSIAVLAARTNPQIRDRGRDVLPTASDRSVLSSRERNRKTIGCFRKVPIVTRPHTQMAVKANFAARIS